MKKLVVSFMFALSLVACSKGDGASSAAGGSGTVEGTYVYNVADFKKEIEAKEEFQKMEEQTRNKIMASMEERLKSFKIEIKAEKVSIYLDTEVITGTLKLTEKTGEGDKYLMTPDAEDKKDEAADFVFKGDVLTVDPIDDKQDKLVFKKQS